MRRYWRFYWQCIRFKPLLNWSMRASFNDIAKCVEFWAKSREKSARQVLLARLSTDGRGVLVAPVCPFPFRLSVHSRARKSSPPSLYPFFFFSCCFLLLFSHYYSSSSRFTVIYSSLVVGIDSVSTDFWLNSSAQSNQPSEKSQKHTHNTAPFFLSFPSCK